MRLSAFFFAFAMVLGLRSTALADDPAADALLAKHYAYVGWQYGDGRVPTMKVHEHTAFLEKSGTLETRYHTLDLVEGLVYRRVTVSGGEGESDTGFTGHVFWTANENGFTVPERGDGIKDRIARQVVFYEATTTLPAIVRKNDTIDGTPVTVIRESIPHAYPIDLYVDPATGAYRRVVFDPEGTDYAIEISRYIDFGDKKRAIGTWHYKESSYRHIVDSIDAGTTISLDELHPPTPRATWSFGNGSAIPIELRSVDLRDETTSSLENRIYLRAKVNGVDGRFILDTGASGIAFTDSFRRRIHSKEIERSQATGIAGSISTIVQKVDTIEFADASVLSNVIVTSGVSEGNEISDGLIGYDFFGGAIVDLNLDKQSIHLFDPATTTPTETGGLVFSPDLSGLVPVVPAMLSGTAKSDVLLDSGNSVFALFATDYLSRVRLATQTADFAGQRSISGVSGNAETDECGKLSNIAIGPISYTNVFTCFSHSVDQRQGIVGLDFIKNFNITFDYPEGKMIFFPRK